ncbi:C4-dicarboxylate ABC transporter permease [Paracidovorax avenae]|uniref:TRAP transporter small permease n=1 Tax=Paracidovorax avenae TaxID=80867 RepID=UPI000D151AE9|nr:TRAP transporter small permease [Paracidovorax avenae]AVS64764.1 C4-dicarboxylate ABC transporter permease [Paracidovorax avenae]AVS69408.1 C4-dicarboxylate ABC transporter permease [Paracidovorax avenae]
MKRWMDRYCRMLDFLMAGALAVMVVMVFGNVVLRYAFNTGITVSEEVSRWLFVWLTFLGAVVAMKDHAHLGVDMLLGRLPDGAKKACVVTGQVLMLWVCWLVFSGSWTQTQLNMDVTAPTTGWSMGYFYFAGVVFAVSAAVFLLYDLWRVLSGQLRGDALVMVKDSEETAEFDALQARLAEEDRLAAQEARDAEAGTTGKPRG